MNLTSNLRALWRSIPGARRVAAGAIGATLLAASANAQCAAWDKTAHDPAGSLFVEGFLVAQQGVAGVEAFSSSARKWTPVSPPGSSVVGSGDWCLLVREPSGDLTAYSARLNNSATLPAATGSPILVASDDDVALVVTFNAIGTITAWGYSAVHGVWTPLSLGAPLSPADFVISRFVIGLRQNGLYHGFSARTGGWTTFIGPTAVGALSADGNTLLANFTPGGVPAVAAFSGVRGCWSLSPTMIPGSPLLLDHNVAYLRTNAAAPGTFRPCAYSAYGAAWVVSGVPQLLASSEAITDNVVQVVAPTFTPTPIDAFGAGHSTWNVLPPNHLPLYIDEDYSIAFNVATLDLMGFSGLCGGPWMPELNGSGVPPIPIAPPDHIGAVDTGSLLHTFRPAKNVWAPAIPKSAGSTVLVADAVLEVAETFGNRAIATRWGAWIGNPAVSPFTVGTGSVIMHQDGLGTIDSFDERCNLWNVPTPLGAPHFMAAGRNLVVFTPDPATLAGAVSAYSVQRGDLISPGALALPLVLGPIAEENVAALVDGGGALWAFGSANDGHTFYQWPNGTEYHTSVPTIAAAPCKPPLFGYGIRANPGSFSYLLLGTGLACPPISIAGICNDLWLPLATASIYSPVGFHDADCMVEFKIGVAGLAVTCIQPWFQPLTLDATTLTLCFGCRRADPAWVF